MKLEEGEGVCSGVAFRMVLLWSAVALVNVFVVVDVVVAVVVVMVVGVGASVGCCAVSFCWGGAVTVVADILL